VVYLVDCGGANLAQGDEVFPDQDHFGGAFYRQCRMSASGIPQIAAVFGECTAGGAYIPALSDEVVMTAGNSSVHLGGPQIVKAAIREIVDRDTLGGAEMHSTVSGVSDHFARDEMEAIAKPATSSARSIGCNRSMATSARSARHCSTSRKSPASSAPI